MIRTNGFQYPLHPLQLLSWVVFALDFQAYLVFGLPLVRSTALQVLAGVLFVTSCFVLVAGAYTATKCDPADPQVSEGTSALAMELDEIRRTFPWCKACMSYVRQRSKHCRKCNKCVDEFDHHCVWLNNCVGLTNYRSFVACIASLITLTSIVLATSIALLVEHYERGTQLESRGYSKGLMLGVLWSLVAVNVPLFVLNLQLCALHLYLAHKDLTTFEYIMRKKAHEDERAATASCEERRRFFGLPRLLDWIVFRKRQRAKGDAASKDGVTAGGPDPGSNAGRTRAPSYTVIGNPVDAKSLRPVTRLSSIEYDGALDFDGTGQGHSDDDVASRYSVSSAPQSTGYAHEEGASSGSDSDSSAARRAKYRRGRMHRDLGAVLDGIELSEGWRAKPGPEPTPAVDTALSLQSSRACTAAAADAWEEETIP